MRWKQDESARLLEQRRGVGAMVGETLMMLVAIATVLTGVAFVGHGIWIGAVALWRLTHG